MPDKTYRRIRLESGFGNLTALVTDGHLPYPYGRELTGYEVADLDSSLVKATGAGATVWLPPMWPVTARPPWCNFLAATSRKSTR